MTATNFFWPTSQLKVSTMTSRTSNRLKNFYALLETPKGIFFTKVHAHEESEVASYVGHYFPDFELKKIMNPHYFWMHKKHNNTKELPKEYV